MTTATPWSSSITSATSSAPASNVLNMTAANPVNALDKWKTKSALFTIDIAGTLPDNAWTADVTIRFAGSIHYER